MPSIQDLNDRFANSPHVRFDQDHNGLIRAVISTEAAAAHLYLHGAHLTHFQPRNQKPVLFLSEKSFFAPAKPIRGGVPVIFPWFGPLNDDRSKMHGFVRLADWEIAQVQNQDPVSITLRTTSSEATKQLWTHNFELEFTASIGETLEMSLQVRNTSRGPFTFEEALHTYFAVEDIRATSVHGLKSETYRDRTESESWQTDANDAVRFTRRVDRLYRDTGATCIIRDKNRAITIAKENSLTTVVWNPWQSPAGEFSDLGENDWQHFVCVETANAKENAVTLPPGATHVMTARIEVQTQ